MPIAKAVIAAGDEYHWSLDAVSTPLRCDVVGFSLVMVMVLPFWW